MVILVNSPLFRESNGIAPEDSLPPIGLGLIATYLQNNDIEVELLDALYLKIPFNELKQIFIHSKPDFIGINIFTTNYEIVRELIESLEFSTHIIIGGLATKELYPSIINWKTQNQIDLVIGDGELITHDIVKGKLIESPFIAIQNRRVFNINHNSSYFLSNISEMRLNRFFFKNEPIMNHYGLLEANIVTSRGCINNCTFCAASRTMNLDYPVRERSVYSIIKELEQISLEYPNIESIRILDDLFLKSKASITKAVLVFSNFEFQWRSMAHVKTFNHVDHNDMKSLRESGCTELFIGIESGSPKILRKIKKTSDRNLIIRNLTNIFKAGIGVKGYFIYGFPDETLEDIKSTYNLAYDLKVLSQKYHTTFRTSVFQFRPYHGSEIYNDIKNKLDFESSRVTPNLVLTNLIGRSQFNFQSGNFSDVCLQTIHEYICKTTELNEPNIYSKRTTKLNKLIQKEKV